MFFFSKVTGPLKHGVILGPSMLVLRWWWFHFFCFHPYLGKMNPFWLMFFQMVWNHQLVKMEKKKHGTSLLPKATPPSTQGGQLHRISPRQRGSEKQKLWEVAVNGFCLCCLMLFLLLFLFLLLLLLLVVVVVVKAKVMVNVVSKVVTVCCCSLSLSSRCSSSNSVAELKSCWLFFLF